MEKFRFYALWLCLICVGVFIVQTVSPGFTDAFVLNQASYFQPWRFLTSVFLHGSFAHLLYNLFALALFGSILEKLIGGKKFLTVFFLSGLLANLVAVNFYSSSLGASGAIYGILGCLAVIKPKMAVWVYSLPMPMFLAAILWIAGSIIGIFIPDNTGHIAHLSGIIIGLLFGLFVRLKIPRKISYTRKIEIPESYMRDWEKVYMRN
ncbi:hypothetical protein A3K73_04235 [Candidatus Pacearchaeota archaeon RBG_13_36_9]|nr:MAG: hypothetical protein A3K73_04235 [Candidatus Pacearchaeota archaeon RBG_13_36_9]